MPPMQFGSRCASAAPWPTRLRHGDRPARPADSQLAPPHRILHILSDILLLYIQEVSNERVPPLEMRVSMGDGNHLLSGGAHARFSLAWPNLVCQARPSLACKAWFGIDFQSWHNTTVKSERSRSGVVLRATVAVIRVALNHSRTDSNEVKSVEVDSKQSSSTSIPAEAPN
ncbi:hypothetical protein EVAR_19555_1 [Eumeta japonica]|uniref:Uncharacterized protein n=1 Tax=Eumeta variegata TaxID=151549 RepID=A0A4C1UF81_EUMVA|nr:hypothetical protein EVAR_19555_1 [Eumeta japonica]